MTDSEPKVNETTPVPPADATPAAMSPEPTEQAAPPPPTVSGAVCGTGRRKSSVARVRMLPGEGKLLVNQREFDQYFHHVRDQADVVAPLDLIGVRKQWDVHVHVHGGGTTGQAGAVRLGLARALIKAYDQHEAALRSAGMLTRDSRCVERKKYGQRKARRRFQFSKR